MVFLLLVVLTDICHSFIFLLAGIGTKSPGRNVDFQKLGTNFFSSSSWDVSFDVQTTHFCGTVSAFEKKGVTSGIHRALF